MEYVSKINIFGQKIMVKSGIVKIILIFFTFFDPLIDSLKFSRIQWDGPRIQDFILYFLCDIQHTLSRLFKYIYF